MMKFTYMFAGILKFEDGTPAGTVYNVKGYSNEPLGVVVKWSANAWSASAEYAWHSHWSDFRRQCNSFDSRKEASIWLQGVTDAQADWFQHEDTENV